MQQNQEEEACDGDELDWRTAAKSSSRTMVRRKALSISLSVEGTPVLAPEARQSLPCEDVAEKARKVMTLSLESA